MVMLKKQKIKMRASNGEINKSILSLDKLIWKVICTFCTICITFIQFNRETGIHNIKIGKNSDIT